MRITLEFTHRELVRWIVLLLGIELLLVFAYVLETIVDIPVWTVRRLMDLNGDAGLAQWLSSIQLAVIGLLFALRASRKVMDLEPARWFLRLAGIGFLFLSADEALYIHETITKLGQSIAWLPSFRGDHGIWVFVYGALGLVLIAACRRQIVLAVRHFPRPARWFAAGIVVFLGGAVGLEVVGYQFLSARSVIYTIEICLEEFMEMAGGTLMLFGALLYSGEAQRASAALTASRAADLAQPVAENVR